MMRVWNRACSGVRPRIAIGREGRVRKGEGGGQRKGGMEGREEE